MKFAERHVVSLFRKLLIKIHFSGAKIDSLCAIFAADLVLYRLKGNLVQNQNYPRSCDPVLLLQEALSAIIHCSNPHGMGRSRPARKVRRPASSVNNT